MVRQRKYKSVRKYILIDGYGKIYARSNNLKEIRKKAKIIAEDMETRGGGPFLHIFRYVETYAPF